MKWALLSVIAAVTFNVQAATLQYENNSYLGSMINESLAMLPSNYLYKVNKNVVID
jgi:hypothetical protein